MKISVIIPFKNADDHIQRCINSCKNAKGDFEFLFIDDNMDDTNDTRLVHKAAKEDERIYIIPSALLRKPGVSGARNTGIDWSVGEWITFLDADDELLPNAYEQMTKAIEEAKGAPVIQMNHLRYYEKIDKTALKYANEAGAYTLQNMPECWCMVWNKLIERELVIGTGIEFVEGLQYGEDEIFNLELMRCTPSIYHAEKNTIAIKRHFDNPESLSHRKGKTELWQQIRALENYLESLDDEESEMKCFVCDLLSEHWQSPTYKRIIGGRDE